MAPRTGEVGEMRAHSSQRAVRSLAAAALVAFLFCTPHVDRGRWQQMPRPEKVLYVKSLLGAEKVKAAKGGNARRYSRSAEEYVQGIDAAYAPGDSRSPSEIIGDLRDR